MEFIAGTIHPNSQNRYVCVGKAEPSVKHLTYLIDNAESYICDWGTEASTEAVRFLANLLLRHFKLEGLEPDILMKKLTSKLDTGKMWILTREEFEQWLTRRVN